FDDEALGERFATQYPELAVTRTVRTRRGQHLYFRVAPHLRVSSRKLAGVDLLSDGHYVVAPPSVIEGHAYTVGRGGLPKALTQADVDRINVFLDGHARRAVAPPVPVVVAAEPRPTPTP